MGRTTGTLDGGVTTGAGDRGGSIGLLLTIAGTDETSEDDDSDETSDDMDEELSAR